MLIYYLDLLGTFTFAVSGALAAAHRKFDIFGALVIGFLTAVGGGTIRDVVLGSAPVFWITDLNYLITIIIAVILTACCARLFLAMPRPLIFFDAIGIGTFTLIGIRKALATGVSMPLAILMGVVTAVMGGMLRDIFSGQIPLILRREIYATACLAGGLAYFGLLQLQAAEPAAAAIAVAAIILVRLLAVRYKLGLPRLRDSA